MHLNFLTRILVSCTWIQRLRLMLCFSTACFSDVKRMCRWYSFYPCLNQSSSLSDVHLSTLTGNAVHLATLRPGCSWWAEEKWSASSVGDPPSWWYCNKFAGSISQWKFITLQSSIHNSSRNLTHVWQILELQRILLLSSNTALVL
jgi:hypothetical protein